MTTTDPTRTQLDEEWAPHHAAVEALHEHARAAMGRQGSRAGVQALLDLGWRPTQEMATPGTGVAAMERLRQINELGYSADHDDEVGPFILAAEAHERIGHTGEVASPASLVHDYAAAAGLLIAAIDVLVRFNPELLESGE